MCNAREIAQYVKCKKFFNFFEAKEGVEVIEDRDVIMSVEIISLKISDPLRTME